MILKYDVMLCGKERERGQREGGDMIVFSLSFEEGEKITKRDGR